MTSIHLPTDGAVSRRDRSTDGPPARTVTVLLTALALVVGLVGPATARGRGFERAVISEGLFYGDFEQDVLLFVGGTTAAICDGADEPTHRARVFERRDGSVDIKVDGSEQPIFLYSSELGAPQFIEATCAAMSDGDDSTVPVEPFAVGEGTVKIRNTIEPDGTFDVVNSTRGSATGPDGTTFRVRGWADLTIVDGVPQGDPADFQGLRVTATGG